MTPPSNLRAMTWPLILNLGLGNQTLATAHTTLSKLRYVWLSCQVYHHWSSASQFQISAVETIQGSTASLNQSRQSDHNKYGYSEEGLPSTVPPPSISRPTPPIPNSVHSSLPPHLSSHLLHSPMMGYKAVNPPIGAMISNSSMSLHNGINNHLSMVSSSANNSSSSSPRQTNVHISEGFSGLPSLPATGLASLPAYNPVYNGGVALGHNPPASYHNSVSHITTVTRQNGGIPSRHLGSAPPPPPPPVSRHNTFVMDSQSPLRQNGGPPIVGRMNVAKPPVSRNHKQYSKNLPPYSQNELDKHHAKKVKKLQGDNCSPFYDMFFPDACPRRKCKVSWTSWWAVQRWNVNWAVVTLCNWLVNFPWVIQRKVKSWEWSYCIKSDTTSCQSVTKSWRVIQRKVKACEWSHSDSENAFVKKWHNITSDYMRLLLTLNGCDIALQCDNGYPVFQYYL